MKISKAKGSMTNTHEAEMKGLSACPTQGCGKVAYGEPMKGGKGT